jgi:hypothetical protein
MKNFIRHSALFIICISLLFSCKKENKILTPIPTDTIIKYDMEDGSLRDVKKAWLDMIHQSSPEVDWKITERDNALEKYNNSKKLATKGSGSEVIANGKLNGEWKEIGSRNQAGSVFATAYNKVTDHVFTISAGGQLWKGKSDGSQWDVQNEFLNFDESFLPYFESGDKTRLVSSIRGLPYFSDDDGVNWTTATGIVMDSRQDIRKWAQTADNEEIFILHKSGYWDNLDIYLSVDKGESYTYLRSFGTHDLNNFGLCSPHHSEDVYLIEQVEANVSQLHKWNRALGAFETIQVASPIGYGNSGRANLVGTADENGVTSLYTFNEDNEFYKSIDEGATWELQSTLSSRPWDVGVFISKSNPQNMLYGDINAYRSNDGGKNWFLVNEWWEYYGDVENKLHADMMYFNEFEDIDGKPFILTSNHGGISKSFNGGITNKNISLSGLNVSQYYSVRSMPDQNIVIFAGSQDQGFQRTIRADDTQVSDFEQAISGDYGHIVFTGNGQHLWTVYPGGWVTYYTNPMGGSIVGDFTLESDDESVWIPPIVAGPIASENTVYMAGGNKDGGSGSHLIKLSADINGAMTVTQSDFDFKSDSGGEISAIAFSPFDPNTIYISTTNGVFYISNDNGSTYERKNVNVPGAHYLYGACILPSEIDPNVIYFSGSGYSVAGVLKSTDGGESWNAMTNGLPSTLTFGLVASEDERYIFAATESGPFVYAAEDDLWYDMAGTSAPSSRYWSLEMLDDKKTIRYGTYGRGIWDFSFEEIISSVSEALAADIKIMPNPVVDMLSVEMEQNYEQVNYSIVNWTGQIVLSGNISSFANLNISHLTAGTYVLLIETEGLKASKKFVKI